ncbi:MAG: nickel pincer cofactor biosynthesis protein LarC [Herbinix sp.]|nr:nickel pincer cofactor biosynthesis protein LarC [Herbinix sp.]
MKEKTLYLECYSGISGDMTVAALLDLGADQKVLLDGLKSLKVDGYKIEIGRRMKNSIDTCDFNVILDSDLINIQEHTHENISHDHSHENINHEHTHENINYKHTPDHNHEPNHEYSDYHNHSHNHNHENDLNHYHDHSHDDTSASTISNHLSDAHLQLGHHEHRNLKDINSIIDASEISPKAKTLAKKIFHIIAVAEAKAHAKSLEDVHFHEVGAIDSIVDIVAAAICLDNLNIENVIVSELYEGTGQIECQHGLLPIPVPAVANITAQHQLPLHITCVKGELVTPTGAAIVAAIKTSDTLPKEIKINKIGLGAGKRNYVGAAGILRAMLIEDASTSTVDISNDKVWVLEANLDDCTGEALAHAMELLFLNGARDVYYTPIFMKKNRPAYLLGVICGESDIAKLEGIIFSHTTTIGIRKHETIRTILPRVQKTVSTSFGDAIVKVCTYQNHSYIYPEYESVKELCQKSGQNYMTMYCYIQNAFRRISNESS